MNTATIHRSGQPHESKDTGTRLVNQKNVAGMPSWAMPAVPFVNGGIAGMTATCVIQPIDMVKVRLQLVGEGVKSGIKPTPLSVTREILSSGRARDLYTGLSAGLLRQAIYTTSRIGFFDLFTKKIKEKGGGQVTFGERVVAALAAGGLSAFLANPADLALVRMQANGLLAVAERKDYTGVTSVISSVVRNEGIRALWIGSSPTVARAMSLNLGQLAFFSESKAQLEKHTNWSPYTKIVASSAIAGFFSSLIGAPFDLVKTRLQRQSKGLGGEAEYRSMFDCFRKVAQREGFTRFYRGFGTFYFRIAPHAMITLMISDALCLMTKRIN